VRFLDLRKMLRYAFSGQFFVSGHYARGDVSDRPRVVFAVHQFHTEVVPAFQLDKHVKPATQVPTSESSTKYYESAAYLLLITPSRCETAVRSTSDLLEFATNSSNNLSRRRPPIDPLSIRAAPLVCGYRKSDSLPKCLVATFDNLAAPCGADRLPAPPILCPLL
jgi:hypothetical protein